MKELKKIKLKDLVVESFVTEMKRAEKVQGGRPSSPCDNTNPIDC